MHMQPCLVVVVAAAAAVAVCDDDGNGDDNADVGYVDGDAYDDDATVLIMSMIDTFVFCMCGIASRCVW